MGTLLAFVIVCAEILVLAGHRPEIERPVSNARPAVGTSASGAVFCIAQMVALPPSNVGTADHLVGDRTRYLFRLRKARAKAVRDGRVVVEAIGPTSPRDARSGFGPKS
jgi:hypothetical protein